MKTDIEKRKMSHESTFRKKKTAELTKQEEFVKKHRRHHHEIASWRTVIFVFFLVLWEISADLKWIDSFFFSSPSRVARCFVEQIRSNSMLSHIGVTLFETLFSFLLVLLCSLAVSTLLWYSAKLSEILEPYLVVLNSLPKIALGPVIIILVGAGTEAIIFMALAISLIVTVLEMLGGFRRTDPDAIRMATTFGATKGQIFRKIVLPSNVGTLFGSLKINIGLSLVGVIAGEFLVSKAGLGYLIVYGGQVFKLDLVMASVIILSVVAALMYQGVVALQKLVTHRR